MCLWYLGWKLGQAQNCNFWKPYFYQWSQFVKTGFRYSNHYLMAWCGIQFCWINDTALIISKGLYCNHIKISNIDLRCFGSSVLLINFWAGGCHQPKKQSPSHYTTWSRRFVWPGSTDFLKFGVIWKPWISSLIVGMIACSALGSECVAAQNVEVSFMKLPKFRKPEKWPHCLGCHALISHSTASYHTLN